MAVSGETRVRLRGGSHGRRHLVTAARSAHPRGVEERLVARTTAAVTAAVTDTTPSAAGTSMMRLRPDRVAWLSPSSSTRRPPVDRTTGALDPELAFAVDFEAKSSAGPQLRPLSAPFGLEPHHDAEFA